MSTSRGWIGVDLDATLAHYTEWKGASHIGEPVPIMRDRVVRWLAEGREVRIFTARVSPQSVALNNNSLEETRKPIEEWCLLNLGKVLPITNEKDMAMIELWDDRAVQVVPNSGLRIDGKL